MTTTLSGVAQVALAAGAAVGGAVHQPIPLILAFTAINLIAATASAALGAGAVRSAERAVPAPAVEDRSVTG